MNLSSKQGFFPGFPLFTGMVGFALRCWLFSAEDDRGLLPEPHIASISCFILLALTLAVCFIAVRKGAPTNAYRKLFPPSELAAVGTVVGAIGMGYTAFSVNGSGSLQLLIPILGVCGAVVLILAGYSRMNGLRPNCLLHGLLTLYFIFRTLVYCQVWGAEPQLQLYFYQLLASIFLLLTCYYRAELDAHAGDCRRYIFFGQAALFCCCLCLPGDDWLFYLSAGIWLATDFCVLPDAKKS